jgi:hypothetical protein
MSRKAAVDVQHDRTNRDVGRSEAMKQPAQLHQGPSALLWLHASWIGLDLDVVCTVAESPAGIEEGHLKDRAQTTAFRRP